MIDKHIEHKHEPALNEVTWKAPEWANHSKGVLWWVCFLLILSLLFSIFYYYQAWWGIIFTLALVILIFSHSFRKPREVLCKLDDKGFKVGKRFYDWRQMISFWMVPNMPYTLLYVRSVNSIAPMVSVEIPITKSEFIFKFLSKRLAIETGRGEILVDKFIRITRL